MADQDLQPGSRLKLYRKGPGDTDFAFVCLATTISFQRNSDSEEIIVNDCDNPDGLTNTRSIKTALSWSITFSGKSDAARIQKIETDYEAENPSQYQIRSASSTGTNGQTYTGAMHITELTLGRPEKGAVTFSAQGKGDGILTRAAAP